MKTILLIILLSASFFLFTKLSNHFDNTTNYDVRIINGFSNNSSMPLVVWCVSYDAGDIGGRALQERDDYSWIVEDASIFWGSSRFDCTMKWESKRVKFEAFRASRDRYRCGALRQCIWLVKEDGFYFSNDGVNWIKDFSWI
ncbi:hypothetical protein CASFOL_021465 [Castilleja foliolosa]|uniref:S-protein homolog n=1 Tax=Castilleja foliolosa TaxID=1961234 RepID=A0ABD3CYM9_9LAMI